MAPKRRRSIVTISSKYRIVIPREVRKPLGLKPKQKLVVLEKSGMIYLVPDEPITRLRGLLRGMSVQGLRDERDKF